MDGIKELLDRISSYNIFNYLLPGILFVILAKEFNIYNFIQENNFLAAFFYYFLGMVISRFGALVIEPFLKGIRFLKFSNYDEFIAAYKKDIKLELLSEINNTYRTLLSAFILLLILKGYMYIRERFHISHEASVAIALIVLIVLFVFAYRRQTDYITKRIRESKE